MMDTIDLLSLGLKSDFDDREASIDTTTSMDYNNDEQESVIIANVKLNSQTVSKPLSQKLSSSPLTTTHEDLITNGEEDSVIVANVKCETRSGQQHVSIRKRQTVMESTTQQFDQDKDKKTNIAVDYLHSHGNDECSVDLEALTYYPPEHTQQNNNSRMHFYDDDDDDVPLLSLSRYTARTGRWRTTNHRTVDCDEENSSFRHESHSKSECIPLKKFRRSSPSSPLKTNLKPCRRYRKKTTTFNFMTHEHIIIAKEKNGNDL